MIQTKIKEAVKPKDKYPSLFCTKDRSSVICVTEDLGNTLSGVVVHPHNSFGIYSNTFSKQKYHKMLPGSELTIKFIQE